MVESEVKIHIRLELDEGDKSKIRGQAKELSDSSRSPVVPDESGESPGGIFGGREDPGVKGFQGRKGLGGGVTKPRDSKSNQPVQRSTFADDTKRSLAEKLGLDDFQAKNVLDFAANPAGAITKQFSKIANSIPVIAAITSAVTSVLAAPEIFKGIVQTLTQRGGPMSKFFKREIEKERNPFRSREQQKLIKIGESQIITTQARGFSNAGGGLLTSNTLSQVRANGISDIGLRDKAGGLF